MNNQRRNVLKTGSGAALLSVLGVAGIIKPGMALADWNKLAFDAKSMADTLKAMGAAAPADSKDVHVTGPDIAENGVTSTSGGYSTWWRNPSKKPPKPSFSSPTTSPPGTR